MFKITCLKIHYERYAKAERERSIAGGCRVDQAWGIEDLTIAGFGEPVLPSMSAICGWREVFCVEYI